MLMKLRKYRFASTFCPEGPASCTSLPKRTSKVKKIRSRRSTQRKICLKSRATTIRTTCWVRMIAARMRSLFSQIYTEALALTCALVCQVDTLAFTRRKRKREAKILSRKLSTWQWQMRSSMALRTTASCTPPPSSSRRSPRRPR